MLTIFSIISTLFSASLTMSMSFVEAEVDYAENERVKESMSKFIALSVKNNWPLITN